MTEENSKQCGLTADPVLNAQDSGLRGNSADTTLNAQYTGVTSSSIGAMGELWKSSSSGGSGVYQLRSHLSRGCGRDRKDQRNMTRKNLASKRNFKFSNSSSGWLTIIQSTRTIDEGIFVKEAVRERARTTCMATMKRLNAELEARKLNDDEVDITVILLNEV